MSVQIPIFVISLKRAPDRRTSITGHLDSLNLSYHVVDAVDGRLIPEEEQRRLVGEGISYAPGVIGCYLSHIEVYKRIVSQHIDVALVLEDDARLNERIVPYLLAGRLVTNDFDYCLLDSENCSEDTPVFYDRDSRVDLFPSVPVFETNIGPALLHAYLITLEGARRRTACALPILKPIDVYSKLPYKPRILVCVEPKGAFVSEHSRQSFTSERHDRTALRLRFLRKYPVFYRIRDLLRFRPFVGWYRLFKMKRLGLIDGGRRWRPMPSGRNIVDV